MTPFLQQVSNWIYAGKSLAGGLGVRNVAVRKGVEYGTSVQELDARRFMGAGVETA